MKKLSAYAALIFSIFAIACICTSSVIRPEMRFLDVEHCKIVHVAVPENISYDVSSEPSAIDIANGVTEFASTLLGRRYVWGATGPKSFDCSGFTSYVFNSQGIKLPRTSRMQYSRGEMVERDKLRAGDLMFFSSPRSGRGRVGHVGIVVDVDHETGTLTFIHASTSKGITYQKFPDGGYYSRNYIGAKRVINQDIAV